MTQSEAQPVWPAFSLISGVCTSLGQLNTVLIIGLLMALGISTTSISGLVFLMICSRGIDEWTFFRMTERRMPASKGPWLRHLLPIHKNYISCCVLIIADLAADIAVLVAAIHSGQPIGWAVFWLAAAKSSSAWLIGGLLEPMLRSLSLKIMAIGVVIVFCCVWYTRPGHPIYVLFAKGLLVHLAVVARAGIADTIFARAAGKNI